MQRRVDPGSATMRDRAWSRNPTFGGLVFLAGLAIAYPIVASRIGHPLTAFALPPLLVATMGRTASIVWVGIASLLVAAVEGALDDSFSNGALIARLVVIMGAVVCAVAGARLRDRRQEQLDRLTVDSQQMRNQHAALVTALHAGSIGGWRWDRASGAVTWDADVERLCGLAPGTFAGTFDSWIALVPAELRDATRATLASSFASGGAINFEHACEWPDRSVHWLRGLGEPVFGAGGEVVGASGVLVGNDAALAAEHASAELHTRDVQQRDRADVLHRATQAIGSSLEFDELVDSILKAVAPGLCEWCRLTLLINDGGSTRARVVTNHPDPVLAAALNALDEQYPFDPESGTSAALVIRTGETIFRAVVDNNLIDALIEEEDRRALTRRVDIRSVIVVPLKGPLGVLGALHLHRSSSRPAFTADDVELAEEVAITIGYALTNALHFDRQRSARRALDILQRLTGRLAVAVTPDDVAREVIVHGASGLGADAGLLYRLESNDRLVLTGQTGYDPTQMQQWATMELGDNTPIADTVKTGRPVVLRNHADMAARYPDYAANTVRDVAVVAFPLQIRRVRTGGIMFTFAQEHDFSQDELTMLETLAGRCAGALERADLYERQRESSLTLQRRMLPELPVLPDALDAAAHYQPASGGEVGGDWYQLFAVRDGCWSAVLGDAVGRGIPAAAAMGQLRGVIIGAASVDPEPARVIAASDAFAALGTDTRAASLAYALIDLDHDEIRHGSAGHLPALVLRRGGSVDVLEGGRGTLLGVRADPAPVAAGHTPFLPGDMLVMYSDGLIERRSETIDEGLERIKHALEVLHDAAPAELCTKLVHALVGDEPIDDDVAVLVVRRVG